MKISFPNCGLPVGISIRAVINALANWSKTERAQTAARTTDAPQITPGWDYRPRKSVQRHAAVDAARAETREIPGSSPLAVNVNKVISFDLIDPGPAVEDARTKTPLNDRASVGSVYD
jgi:hypothetical protein